MALSYHGFRRSHYTGFAIVARLDRQPYPDVEHPSERVYLLAR